MDLECVQQVNRCVCVCKTEMNFFLLRSDAADMLEYRMSLCVRSIKIGMAEGTRSLPASLPRLY